MVPTVQLATKGFPIWYFSSSAKDYPLVRPIQAVLWLDFDDHL
jgi:hypothetical protein